MSLPCQKHGLSCTKLYHLVGVIYQGGQNGHMLAMIDVPSAAQEGVAEAISEALSKALWRQWDRQAIHEHVAGRTWNVVAGEVSAVYRKALVHKAGCTRR